MGFFPKYTDNVKPEDRKPVIILPCPECKGNIAKRGEYYQNN
jgi:hypothetical protein